MMEKNHSGINKDNIYLEEDNRNGTAREIFKKILHS